MELRVAVCESLREGGGIAILSRPHRFCAYIMDKADPDSPLVNVFMNNCDSEYLKFFSDMAKDCTRDNVLSTVNRATALLVQVRWINLMPARRLTCEIAVGVCAHLCVVPPEEVLSTIREEIDWNDSVWKQDDFPPDDLREGGRSTRTKNLTGEDREADTDELKQISGGGSIASSIAGKTGQNGVTTAYQFTPKHNIGMVAAVALIACIAVAGMLFAFWPRTVTQPPEPPDPGSYDGGSGKGGGSEEEPDEGVEESETVSLVGTWSPISVNVGAEDTYESRLRRAREGNLILRDDGTMSRSLFPDVLEGSWESISDSSAKLSPKEGKGILASWNAKDVANSLTASYDGESLSVTYGDGVSVTYEREARYFETDELLGLWEIVELARDGVIQYGQDVFDRDRTKGWYTEYLDLRSNGTVIWDQQGSMSQGSWRMTDDNQAVVYIRNKAQAGSYWCGLLELEDGRLTFHFNGEGNWEAYQKAEKDNRSELKMPE